MWQLLGNLVSGFLLLRDVFGYVIPGAVFLAIVAHTHGGSSHPPVSDTPWFVFLILLLASYVIGQILVTIGYTFYGGVGWIRRGMRRATTDNARADEQYTNLQYYRYLYPAMFNERDRRDTVNILRIGLAVAFVVGAWLLPAMPLVITMLVVGVLMLYNGHTGLMHVVEFGDATIAAGRKAELNHVPFFKWSAPDAKSDAKDDAKDGQDGAKHKPEAPDA